MESSGTGANASTYEHLQTRDGVLKPLVLQDSFWRALFMAAQDGPIIDD